MTRVALVALAAVACSDGAVVLERVDAAAPAAARYDYCAELPPLARAPALDDGEIDEALPLADVPSTLWDALGNAPFPAGYRARLAAAWRPDGLYAFFDVTDPDRLPAPPDARVWWGDGVEVYVDHDGVLAAPPAYDDPGTRHLLYGAPVDDATPVTRAERTTMANAISVTWAGARAIARPRPGGYTVEAFVAAADLDLTAWTLSAGAQVGFDVSFDVSYPVPTMGPHGNRMGAFPLRADPARPIPESFPFNTSRAFCLPTLRARR